MSISIRIVKETVMMPEYRGDGFDEMLTNAAISDYGEQNTLTLEQVSLLFKDFWATSPSDMALGQAQSFVAWCRNYWSENDLPDDWPVELLIS